MQLGLVCATLNRRRSAQSPVQLSGFNDRPTLQRPVREGFSGVGLRAHGPAGNLSLKQAAGKHRTRAEDGEAPGSLRTAMALGGAYPSVCTFRALRSGTLPRGCPAEGSGPALSDRGRG